MKILVYVLIALLVATLGFGAYFYLLIHQPMNVELTKLQQGQPEFDRVRKELKKYQDREKQETGWMKPVVDTITKGLANEIATGKAEVVAADNRIVVNIDDSQIFTPQSVTFTNSSDQLRAWLAVLLKDLKDREIIVGDATQAVPAKGKGRKKTPPKDARMLASGRTYELVKYLEKNNVAPEIMAAAAYPTKLPDHGFKLKENKVIIIISSPATAAAEAAPAKAAPAAKTAPPAQPAPQQKPIPITPAPPKKVQ